ncbi:serine acetyltransferase [Alicyclobacillus cycloheptanicus]|uniref:Serine O-acetyltransferase n=1 Tax=Alicyclobacillus cycloheptanicus TaxID=1457 RepID=A0ABT9XHC1_9BACL|nr:serine O-acetyltransferase EpsC [Alicyclobacillus cycloheptanicus]MDQ0189704.1 serine O-acetyltransferase [Alicyclobacillus cycloheptanicus]WDM01916.1 serine acetyltransferase [Alicyclobacillus cycloheptanicus]
MADLKRVVEQLKNNSCTWFEGRACHPEAAEIDRMIGLARQVLLPNYFSSANVEKLCAQMQELRTIMAGQIHRAMFQKCIEKDATVETRAIAEAQADAVIERFPEVQQILHEDVVETYNGDPAATGYDEIILTYPGIFALTVYRIAHVMVELNIPLLPRMMGEHAHRVTGIELHPGATIGRGVMIDHGTGIVVGETAVVGDHVKIYQGVTLGALYFPRDESGSMVRKTKRHPTVEDYVVLYANATVLGGDTVIGHHSVIGSNAWITESLPPYSKALYQTETVVHTRGV